MFSAVLGDRFEKKGAAAFCFCCIFLITCNHQIIDTDYNVPKCIYYTVTERCKCTAKVTNLNYYVNLLRVS